ncbi:glycosyltransferase family 2 protein [Marinobacter sp. HL-58]|uniref:glycosyltransferase family 2 protein n=1 Tax=Marinobacter sp. HL-58 TaxID=1479237 RepID=UPI0006DA73AA|nr:glycosyltransferase family A protein [Marinobacter sp. HL-58]KPQ01675.1 MAG: Glycosyltransferases involved in cell wall biogenesis [Marinobacter sp. HL-58]
MDVTAIIPTRGDRLSMLHEALKSVSRQSIRAQHTLVVVDGTEAIQRSVSEHISHFPNVSVVTTAECQGVSVARNLGAALAKTRYIAFLDDDDLWLPDHLAPFANDDFDLGLSAFWKQGQDKCVHEKTPPAVLHPRRFFVTNGGCRGSNLVVRTDLFLAQGGFDPHLKAFNDVDFAIRMSRNTAIRYRRNRKRTVVFRNHSGARLSRASMGLYEEAANRFFERYSISMSSIERDRFREWVARVKQIS